MSLQQIFDTTTRVGEVTGRQAQDRAWNLNLHSPADRYGTGGGLVVLAFFFVLFFPLIWASGVWVGPIGPAIGGVFWLSFVLPAVFLIMLLFALDPGPRRPITTSKERVELPGGNTEKEVAAEENAAVAFGIFFWELLIATPKVAPATDAGSQAAV